MPEPVVENKALSPPFVQVFWQVRIKPATTIKYSLYREIACTTLPHFNANDGTRPIQALDRIPVRYGQPQQGWDRVEEGWYVEAGVGLGVTEKKSEVVGGRI